MGVQSVGYLEAWWLWWHGVDVKPMTLHGFPMLWVGRIAKFVAFLGGLVVLIDLLGPERVKRYSVRFIRSSGEKDFFGELAAFIVGAAMAITFAASLANRDSLENPVGAAFSVILLTVGAILCGLGFWQALVKAIARALDSDRGQVVVRWASFITIALAFSFDMLTS